MKKSDILEEISALMDSIEIQEFMSEEDTALVTQAFLQNEGHPVTSAWEKIIKVRKAGYYWQLSHMGKNDPLKAQKILDFSGRIQELEELLLQPKRFIDKSKEIAARDLKPNEKEIVEEVK